MWWSSLFLLQSTTNTIFILVTSTLRASKARSILFRCVTKLHCLSKNFQQTTHLYWGTFPFIATNTDTVEYFLLTKFYIDIPNLSTQRVFICQQVPNKYTVRYRQMFTITLLPKRWLHCVKQNSMICKWLKACKWFKKVKTKLNWEMLLSVMFILNFMPAKML